MRAPRTALLVVLSSAAVNAGGCCRGVGSPDVIRSGEFEMLANGMVRIPRYGGGWSAIDPERDSDCRELCTNLVGGTDSYDAVSCVVTERTGSARVAATDTDPVPDTDPVLDTDDTDVALDADDTDVGDTGSPPRPVTVTCTASGLRSCYL